MQKRTIEKHIRLNEKEAADWKRKCELTGLPLSTIIRMLVNGFEPKEKPDLRFYETMNQITEFTSELRKFRLQAQHQKMLILSNSRRWKKPGNSSSWILNSNISYRNQASSGSKESVIGTAGEESEPHQLNDT